MSITIDTLGPDGSRFVAQVVPAGELQVGQIVTNVGRVEDIKRDGVFVLVALRGMRWDRATGRGASTVEPTTWHEAQDVAINTFVEAGQ